MNNTDKFVEYLEVERKNKTLFKEKVIVHILYYICVILYILHAGYTSSSIFLVLTLTIITILFLEVKLKLNKVYYSIKTIAFLFILNILLLSVSTALIVTLVFWIVYLWQRRRELIHKYNSIILKKKEDNKRLALMAGGATILVLRMINPTFDFDAWWYVILILMNIIFSIEFNLINDLYDSSFVRLLKVDEYIKTDD